MQAHYTGGIGTVFIAKRKDHVKPLRRNIVLDESSMELL